MACLHTPTQCTGISRGRWSWGAVLCSHATGACAVWITFGTGSAPICRRHPDIRYLFGPVSISDGYPRAAKDMLVHFYRHYFGDEGRFALARDRYVIAEAERSLLHELFCGTDYEQDFRVLKEQLGRLGLAVPTLYKQYTEVCEPGGTRFLDFGVDAQFSNCVDGLVLVDLHLLKSGKRARYIADQGATPLSPVLSNARLTHHSRYAA